eukprot:CAMPEP_0182531182 /NCGR_PEP_ID=MMETSP1323-20130603/8155_1 /TAXON_ID=236787 /ORGANISM="Florenciella parvula, Strain RCC1693" /LENGTH=233 /DNA_ID=CAMNT_0024740683 /DNA_START=8 /DNA_END=709 /DNA_ORIENTATION=-
MAMKRVAVRALREVSRAPATPSVSACRFSTSPASADDNMLHRTSMPHVSETALGGQNHPMIQPDVFVAPSATVVGDVQINFGASVWYNAVIRGDKNQVKVGAKASVGDRVSVSTVASLDSGFPAICDIGYDTVIGSGSSLVSCTVMPGATIGENCVILEGALVEAKATVLPGSVVPPGRRVPAGQIWGGNPVEYVGENDPEHGNEGVVESESLMAADHIDEFLPINTAFWQKE